MLRRVSQGSGLSFVVQSEMDSNDGPEKMFSFDILPVWPLHFAGMHDNTMGSTRLPHLRQAPSAVECGLQ